MICYLVAVIRLWSPENKQVLSYLAIPLWLLTMFCVIANAGALQIPLAFVIVVLMAVGYYTDRHGEQKDKERKASDVKSGKCRKSEDKIVKIKDIF